MAIETIETRTRMSTYSTNPCPSSRPLSSSSGQLMLLIQIPIRAYICGTSVPSAGPLAPGFPLLQRVRDRLEDAADLEPEGREDRDRDDRDEHEDERVFDEPLPFLMTLQFLERR